MKKSNITGWKEVLTFTLTQTFKNKAFIISYLILLTLALVSMPIINLFISSGSDETVKANTIEKVYVHNQTSLPPMDFRELRNMATLSHISFETMQESYDTISERIEQTENTSVILTLSEKEGRYSLHFVKASKGPVKNNSLHALATAVSDQFSAFRITTLGITSEQLELINAEVATLVSISDMNGLPVLKEDTSISLSEYWFIYGILFFVLMVNVMASTQIATSIVTEKSTRVIEFLLISVKPLALMVGKIIAMLIAVLIQMGSMILILLLSGQITARFSPNGANPIQYLPKDIFQNLNVLNLIFCILLIVLGMIFYATLAGLTGATVSRQEEISEGLTLFTFTNLAGAYTGIGAAAALMGSGVNSFVHFAFLFPLSSPFVLPGAILIGKASIPLILIAIALQVIFILLLFRFVARVYEALILHNGNKIKFKELFKLSRTV